MNKKTKLSFQILQIDKKIKKYLKAYDILSSLNDKQLLAEVEKRLYVLDKELKKTTKELNYLEEMSKTGVSIVTKYGKTIILP